MEKKRREQADIVLATLNARHIHASFGLRYLMANLGELQPRAQLLEFDIHQRALEIAETILARAPRLVGLGVYIWNAQESLNLAAVLKRLAPEVILVIGGPEVSYELDRQEIVMLADHTIAGEGDLAFAELCRERLGGRPMPKIVAAPLPALDRIALPYELYTDEDLAHRVTYVEASRGCPFTCEFCLSSLDSPVRAFPLDAFLGSMRRLLERGARQFKFVDRTFNLNLTASRAILDFFLSNWRDGMFLHFEMVPDRLPEALREPLSMFPAGSVQLEVGIQTFDETCAKLISRRQNISRLEDNLRFLREKTGAHVHADLIAGLPGESLEQFARGFDRLAAMEPQEIQVGILKRLRGTPIVRHDVEWHMIYSPLPPYELLRNKLLDFETMQRLRRFARFWDAISNSARFPATKALLCRDGSVFWNFLAFSDWLSERVGRTHSLALETLACGLYEFLTDIRRLPPDEVRRALEQDWGRATGRGRLKLPESVESNSEAKIDAPKDRRTKRQARHLQA